MSIASSNVERLPGTPGRKATMLPIRLSGAIGAAFKGAVRPATCGDRRRARAGAGRQPRGLYGCHERRLRRSAAGELSGAELAAA
jgi:hypothetical protein